MPGILLMAAANSAFAVCLVLLFRRVMTLPRAMAVAFAWVVMPSHLSQEVWLSCVNIAWSQGLAAVGLVVGWRDPRRSRHLVVAGTCFLLAVVAYEATVAVLLVAAAALPWAERRRLDWPLLGTAVTASLVGGAWVAAHWVDSKRVARRIAPIGDVFAANFGWSFSAPGRMSTVLTVAALALVALSAGRHLLPAFRSTTAAGDRLVLAGALVMLAGTVPFALFVYEPLGAGDRMNGLSAVGAALVLVGAASLVASRSRLVLGIGVAALFVAASVTRFERMWLWHVAGSDARAIVAATVATIPDPAGVIVIGPEPVSNEKIVAFLEESSITAALQLAYATREVRATVSQDSATFSSAPPGLRVDIRPLSRLDETG